MPEAMRLGFSGGGFSKVITIMTLTMIVTTIKRIRIVNNLESK